MVGNPDPDREPAGVLALVDFGEPGGSESVVYIVFSARMLDTHRFSDSSGSSMGMPICIYLNVSILTRL